MPFHALNPLRPNRFTTDLTPVDRFAPLHSMMDRPKATNSIKKAPSAAPQFGFNPVALNPVIESLTGVSRWLGKHPLASVVLIDVLGFNMPMMGVAATRSKGDFWDTFRHQAANTSITILGALSLPFISRGLASIASGVGYQALAQDMRLPQVAAKLGNNLAKNQLAHLGTALGFLVPYGVSFMASPYLRNIITLKTTGTANFQAIIGLEKADTQTEKRSYADEMAYQTRRFKAWALGGLAVGAGLALGLGGLARLAPKAGPGVKTAIDKLYKTFKLGGGLANEVAGDLSTLIFWLAPAYVGTFIASRSHHEKREQLIKGLNSMLWFTAIHPIFTDRLAAGKVKNVLKQFPHVRWQGLPALDAAGNLLKQPTAMQWLFGQKRWLPSDETLKALQKTAPQAYKRLSTIKVAHTFGRVGLSITGLVATYLFNVFWTKKAYAHEQQMAPVPTAGPGLNPLSTSPHTTFSGASFSGYSLNPQQALAIATLLKIKATAPGSLKPPGAQA